MRIKDREIEKINDSEIRRIETILYKIDKYEKDFLKDFDNNISTILVDALKPILEEIKSNKALIENIDTRIIKINNQDYIIPANFLISFHKSYIQNPNLKILFEEKLKQWFKNKTVEIRNIIKDIKSNNELEKLLPISYAISSLAVTAFHKKPNMILRDVQKIAGIAINEGSIAELCTGEGKTLSVILPTYFQALSGKGAHVITSNSYLSKRDYEETFPIFEGLGLSSGFLIDNELELADTESLDLNNLSSTQKINLQEKLKKMKQDAYMCDITYGSKQTFASDYLKDNMVKNKKDLLQRIEKPQFALIDEIDEVLIDDAKEPYKVKISMPMYHKNMTIDELCIMQGIRYEEVLPKIRLLGIVSNTLSYEEARYISKKYGHKELLHEKEMCQELANKFLKIQKIFVTDDNTYSSKKGKELYEAIFAGEIDESNDIKNQFGIILCKELNSYKISDKCYDDFLKYSYFNHQINSLLVEFKKEIIEDHNYIEGKDYIIEPNEKIKFTIAGASKVLNDNNYPDFLDDYNNYLTMIKEESSILIYYLNQALNKTLFGQEDLNKQNLCSTITQKDFYSRYTLYGGMTSTSSKSIFQEVYDKSTIEIPRYSFYNFYSRRKKDYAKEPMQVEYKNTIFTLELDNKIELIINSILESQKTSPKQPVLLVVSNINEIPLLQKSLTEKGIAYNTITNLVSKEEQALIISKAGLPGMVTISTEIIPRGTNIKIGGDRDTIIDLSTEKAIKLLEKELGTKLSFSTSEKELKRKETEDKIISSPIINLWTKEYEEKARELLEPIGLKVIASGLFKEEKLDRELEESIGINGSTGIYERYVYPLDLEKIGLNTDILSNFRVKENKSLDVDEEVYNSIMNIIKIAQNNNEEEIKEDVKKAQKLNSYTTSLIEKYREERKNIICGTANIDLLTKEMIKNATDAIISFYISDELIQEQDLKLPITDCSLNINVDAISLEVKDVLGISFDSNIVKKSNINLLEFRDAIIRTADVRRMTINKEANKEALIMKYDFIISNISKKLENCFIVKDITLMSKKQEDNSNTEIDKVKKSIVLEASKQGIKKILGLQLTKEEFKKLEYYKLKIFNDKIAKSKKIIQEPKKEVNKVEHKHNSPSTIEQLKEIRRKIVDKNNRDTMKEENHDNKKEKKSIDIEGLYYNVVVRPLRFINSTVNGKKLTNLVLNRKSTKETIKLKEALAY